VDANTAGFCIECGALVPDTLYFVLHMKLGVRKILTFIAYITEVRAARAERCYLPTTLHKNVILWLVTR
jgi:hypothetical protein